MDMAMMTALLSANEQCYTRYCVGKFKLIQSISKHSPPPKADPLTRNMCMLR
jgi:hypothetical protein